SKEVHEKAPWVKSLLLAGPPGVGKKMLVHAICTETGSNLFNLSASNIAGKYPGKSGLQMMLHLVFKVTPVKGSFDPQRIGQTGNTVLWKEIILRHGGVLTDALDISCLSKVTDGFTQGQIVQVVKEVLTDHRIRQQAYKPLTGVEFITMMTGMNPVYKEEEESFKGQGITWERFTH
ncbi:hypothetical protein STEG23_025801, partial [Scotinomys teguina]